MASDNKPNINLRTYSKLKNGYALKNRKNGIKIKYKKNGVLPISSNVFPPEHTEIVSDNQLESLFPSSRAVKLNSYILPGAPCSSTTCDPNDFGCKSLAGCWHDEHWIGRKFYIVENGCGPSEVFRTDFLTRDNIHHRNNNKTTADSPNLLRITDRWREEWNGGVQVPLSRSRQSYLFEYTNIFPDLPSQPAFQLPKKRIALNMNRRNYFVQNSSKFLFSSRIPLYHYNLDDNDDAWLDKINSAGIKMEITRRDLTNVMNALEISTYRNMHAELLHPLESKKTNPEDDAECEICRMPEWEQDDEIVFCDGCNTSVHQSCYGIDVVPKGEWLCKTCELGRSSPLVCSLCPIQDGPMKPIKNSDSWAHVICALWIPEVRFGDIEKREPITALSEIPPERWQSKCSVCDTRQGACIECTEPRCHEPFHVACALRANFVLHIAHDLREPNGIRMISLCHKHSSNNLYRNRRRSSKGQIKRLSELMKNFSKFADLNEITSTLSLPLSLVSLIFDYWEQKRNANRCNPLVTEPIDVKLSEIPGEIEIPEKREKRAVDKTRSKSRTRTIVPSYDSVITPELRREFERVRFLRLNLEKARNLSYMIKRREKLKRSQVELLKQQSLCIGGLLLDPSLPLSKRRTDKLLSLWRNSIIDSGDDQNNAEFVGLLEENATTSSGEPSLKGCEFYSNPTQVGATNSTENEEEEPSDHEEDDHLSLPSLSAEEGEEKEESQSAAERWSISPATPSKRFAPIATKKFQNRNGLRKGVILPTLSSINEHKRKNALKKDIKQSR